MKSRCCEPKPLETCSPVQSKIPCSIRRDNWNIHSFYSTDQFCISNQAMWQFIPCDYDDLSWLEVHIDEVFLCQIPCLLQNIWISGCTVEDISTSPGPAETEVTPVRSYERL